MGMIIKDLCPHIVHTMGFLSTQSTEFQCGTTSRAWLDFTSGFAWACFARCFSTLISVNEPLMVVNAACLRTREEMVVNTACWSTRGMQAFLLGTVLKRTSWALTTQRDPQFAKHATYDHFHSVRRHAALMNISTACGACSINEHAKTSVRSTQHSF